MAATRHLPVMAGKVVAALAPRAGGFYVDGTLGGGGYARALLDAADCFVLGLDRDPIAIKHGEELARRYGGRLSLACARFSEMQSIAGTLGHEAADGVALDLGLSSDQLSDAQRGFSFSVDGPLDMRMTPEGPTAADLVNGSSEAQLVQILRTYGEEPQARSIARAIVEERRATPITRTIALARLVERAVGARRSHARIHPATRTFQALRIAVNGELEELASGLAAAERLLAPSGRLAVVAFHSLEDRIVKRFLAARSGWTSRGSRHAPALGTEPPAPSFRVLSRRAITPDAGEVAENPRARSAKLRAAERTTAQPHPLDRTSIGVPSLPLTILQAQS
jgi:16S rRNA (cytosine1402-N4)-methyltransferase